jgi:glycosyltransferase involved in cell wall biosynthesis
MKILHIVPSYKPAYIYGGPIESVARLCEGLSAAGHTVHVYTTTANGKAELEVPVGKPVDVDGVQVTYFKRITKDPTHISPALWKELYRKANEYDIVHIHSWWNILVMMAAKICLFKTTKVIVAPRGMLSQYIFNSGSSKIKKAIHSMFGRRLLAQTHFHATAQSEYIECVDLIPGWSGFVLPNIISLPPIPVYGQENKVFTLIFLSRIHPKKGLEMLIEAVSKVNFEVKLKIAGNGDEGYIAELKQLANLLQVSDKIEWLGWMNRDQKFVELMNADLFTLVSLNENFANVVIEALHMGTAVLVSEDVALSGFIKEKDMGWVSNLQVTGVIEKLTEAKLQVTKRNHIRSEGRKVIEENFSEHKLIKAYAERYSQIAGY